MLPQLTPASRATCDMVAARLEADAASMAEIMTEAVLREVAAYASQPAPQIRQAVHAHSLEHVHAIVRTIRTWTLPSGDELAFVRARAAMRAAQHMPLSALLHSYRIGHRTVWERLAQMLGDRPDVLDPMLALTMLTLHYTDVISAALAEGYVEGQRQQLLEFDRDRRDLLENLLRGGAALNPDILRLAATFDLLQGSEFLVVVLAGTHRSGALASEGLTRAAESLRRQLSVVAAQPFVVARLDEVVGIVPLHRGRPASIARSVRNAHSELARRSETWAAGVSTICCGLVEVARGYEEARRAFEAVPQGNGVSVLLEMRLTDYLLERADTTAARIVPQAARRLLESTLPSDLVLVETLLEYAEVDMAVREAAERLCVHPNTVSYRLEKIHRLVGRDPTRFSDLHEIVTWTRLLRGRDTRFGEAHNAIANYRQSVSS